VNCLVKVGGSMAAAAGAMILLAGPALAAPSTIIGSDTEAGYSATVSTAITSLSSGLSVPTVTCPATGNLSLLSEFYLKPATGTETGLLGWNDTCTGGVLSQPFAFVDVGGANASINISAGDSLKFSLAQATGTSAVTLKVTDATNGLGASVSANVSPSFTIISAVTFVSNGSTGNVTPIPSFTPIHFSALKVNGAILTTFTPAEYEMYDGTTLQIATSTISTAGTFTTTFRHV
jgi:hypothetical protein